MRTTITLDDDVFRAAKMEAAASGRTLSAVVQDALCKTMREQPGRDPFRLPVSSVSGNGLPESLPKDDLSAVLAYRDEDQIRLPVCSVSVGGLREGLSLDDISGILDYLDEAEDQDDP